MWGAISAGGAKPRGDRVPAFPELRLQVLSDNTMPSVVILCPVDAKLLVVQDQLQDALKSLSCDEVRSLASMLPSIDRRELQSILAWQGLPKLPLALRREKKNSRENGFVQLCGQKQSPACFCKSRFLGAESCPFIFPRSVAACTLQTAEQTRQSPCDWPTESKLLPTSPFTLTLVAAGVCILTDMGSEPGSTRVCFWADNGWSLFSSSAK